MRSNQLKKQNFVREKKYMSNSLLLKVNPGHLNSHGNNALQRNDLANLFKYDLLFNHHKMIAGEMMLELCT